MQTTPEVSPKKSHARREVMEWIKSIAIALVLAFIIRSFLFTMIRVDGRSMQDTLQDGDRVAVTILDMKLSGPARGDVVICTYPGADHLCVKRVIGLPGETLEIRDGTTYINGEAIAEDYVTRPKNGQNISEITLDADSYFVMGDNRAISKDSRDPSVGPLRADAIGGKARLILWPLSRVGGVE